MNYQKYLLHFLTVLFKIERKIIPMQFVEVNECALVTTVDRFILQILECLVVTTKQFNNFVSMKQYKKLRPFFDDILFLLVFITKVISRSNVLLDDIKERIISHLNYLLKAIKTLFGPIFDKSITTEQQSFELFEQNEYQISSFSQSDLSATLLLTHYFISLFFILSF